MVKTVLKEFIIILLMCIAIVVVLGVVLYGYVPNNSLPSKIAYETPDTIENELVQDVAGNEMEKQNIIYEIRIRDLLSLRTLFLR